jgi:hypothetical protein
VFKYRLLFDSSGAQIKSLAPSGANALCFTWRHVRSCAFFTSLSLTEPKKTPMYVTRNVDDSTQETARTGAGTVALIGAGAGTGLGAVVDPETGAEGAGCGAVGVLTGPGADLVAGPETGAVGGATGAVGIGTGDLIGLVVGDWTGAWTGAGTGAFVGFGTGPFVGTAAFEQPHPGANSGSARARAQFGASMKP